MFVRDQIKELAKVDPSTEYYVLAPYDHRLRNKNNSISENLHVIYFRYMWPRQLCTLNAEGLWPAIQKNPAKLILVPPMMVCFIFIAVRLALKKSPDLLYAHWLTPQGIVAYTSSLIAGAPFAFTSHASDASILDKLPFIGKLIVKLCTRRARGITVVSKRTRNKLRHFFTDTEWESIEGKVHTIPMGTSVSPSSGHRRTQQHQPYILFMGRLAEKKGVAYLIKGFQEFASHHPEYTLKIAGIGPLKAELSSLISSLNLQDKVSLVGYAEGKIKESLIGNCDIFIVPSIITKNGDSEGLPVSLLEGLSAGKLCIATKESGADEVIEQSCNGFLIDQKSPKAISEALHLAANLDEASIDKIRRNAIRTARKYSWEEIGHKYYQFLMSATNDKKNTHH